MLKSICMKNTMRKCLALYEDTETLLATVSHDLKNPIISAIIAIKTLENPKISSLQPNQKEVLDNVLASLNYMKSLITNILDTYRINNNLMAINKTPVNFETFIKNILDETQYIFKEKNQQVRLISKLKNYKINIDPLEMQRVIQNLLINSSIYSTKNSEIIVDISDTSDFIYFSIKNDGFGIENPQMVCEKSYSIDYQNKTVSTGLGLYIVKEIITKHSGKIFIESELNKSTKISFMLPRK